MDISDYDDIEQVFGNLCVFGAFSVAELRDTADHAPSVLRFMKRTWQISAAAQQQGPGTFVSHDDTLELIMPYGLDWFVNLGSYSYLENWDLSHLTDYTVWIMHSYISGQGICDIVKCRIKSQNACLIFGTWVSGVTAGERQWAEEKYILCEMHVALPTYCGAN